MISWVYGADNERASQQEIDRISDRYNAKREKEAGMSKFKVGDKVRRVYGGNPCAPIGFEAVLIHGSGGVLAYRNKEGDLGSFNPNYWDLIEPAQSGPVRTVTTTRKEIVPGVYGRLKITPIVSRDQWKNVAIQFVMRGDIKEIAEAALSPSELRAAAETFTQLADALESGE